MTCSGSLFERDWPRGQVDYLDASITLTDGLGDPVSIQDDEPVAFTFDRVTFYDGAWLGVVGSTRTCQVLVDDDMLPAYAVVDVFVRVTDTTTTPLIPVGTLNII
jgi:hypothetical protein